MKNHRNLLWIPHLPKYIHSFSKKNPLRILDATHVEVLFHPEFPPVVLDTGNNFACPVLNKSNQLYLYAGLWMLFTDFNDAQQRQFCLDFLQHTVRGYNAESKKKKNKSILHDDHVVSERATVLTVLLEHAVLQEHEKSDIQNHLDDLYLHITALVQSDHWLHNNHRLFHLMALIVLELHLHNNIAAAKKLSSDITFFLEQLIDTGTMLCKEQSVYYMGFDIALLQKIIRALSELGLASEVAKYQGSYKTYLNSISVLAYPDGTLPAFGDTPLGASIAPVQTAEAVYGQLCDLLAPLGYHKIYNQNFQVIMLEHCAESPHGHNSPLHVDIWNKTHGLLVTDAGGPYIYGDEKRYTYFRAPYGHNTLCFENQKTLDIQSIAITREANHITASYSCTHGSLKRNVLLQENSVKISDSVESLEPWCTVWHMAQGIELRQEGPHFALVNNQTGLKIGECIVSGDEHLVVSIEKGLLTFGHKNPAVEGCLLKITSAKLHAAIQLKFLL